MKKIANIVSKENIEVSQAFNVIKTMDECIHGLPTLIADFDYVNKNYPNFDIMDICIEDNLYWTFSRKNKRDKHNEDLKYFINKVYSDLLKGIPYFYLDLINYKSKTILRAIKKIYLSKNIFTYFYNEMLYIYVDKIIFGIDLKLLKFMDFNITKLKNKIIKKSTVFLSHEEILIEYKLIFDEIEHQVRFMPYLISILHEEKITISNIHFPRETNMVS